VRLTSAHIGEAAPNMNAELRRIAMAMPPLVAVFLCRSRYFGKSA